LDIFSGARIGAAMIDAAHGFKRRGQAFKRSWIQPYIGIYQDFLTEEAPDIGARDNHPFVAIMALPDERLSFFDVERFVPR
jgi:hypothetical protein